MSRPRIILIAVIAILLVVALLTKGFGLFDRAGEGPLTLNGNVDIRQVELGLRVPGRIATMAYEEGAKVPTGAVLAQLDTRPLDDMLAQAEARIAASEAQLALRRNGNRSQDIAQAAAAVAEQQAGLAKVREEYARRRGLVATGAISRAQFDATEADYRAAQARVRAAEQALSLQRAGSRPEEIAAARADTAGAVAQRDKARTDLADATLRAPIAGTVLTRAREPGAIVQAGETLYTLTIDRPMRVRAYIAEPDLTRISPGMAVTVTADGNPKAYHGTIGFIAPTAEFTPKSVQTEDLRADLVYRLRVIVTDPDDGLRQGQPVTVHVADARPRAKR